MSTIFCCNLNCCSDDFGNSRAPLCSRHHFSNPGLLSHRYILESQILNCATYRCRVLRSHDLRIEKCDSSRNVNFANFPSIFPPIPTPRIDFRNRCACINKSFQRDPRKHPKLASREIPACTTRHPIYTLVQICLPT